MTDLQKSTSSQFLFIQTVSVCVCVICYLIILLRYAAVLIV